MDYRKKDLECSELEMRPTAIGETQEVNSKEDDYVVYQFNHAFKKGKTFTERMKKKMLNIQQDEDDDLSKLIDQELAELNEVVLNENA